jgi:glycosyltransferase involved in cell wall biosynthesis
MSQKDTILYIKSTNSSFINTDQRILEKTFRVIPFLMNQSKDKLKYGLRLISLALFILGNIHKVKILAVWFADYDAAVMVFFGKLFNKKTVIFVGGQEAICYEDLRKGVYLKKFRGDCVRYAIRNATLIIPNHQSLIYHENYYYNAENPHIDGLKKYVGNYRCKVEVVPNGIDDKRIIRDSSVPKQPNLVLTVGHIGQKGDFYNKGYDLLIEVARNNPDLEFVFISIKPPFLDWVESEYSISKISNLKVISEFCPDDVLSDYYNKARVYVQASITEGMPVSLSEAMLCECIPVGSNVNGIPDAIGDTGVIIKHRDARELEQAVRKALLMDTGKQARERVIDNFSFTIRENRLTEIFRGL